MKTKILGLLAVGLLAGPMAAKATAVYQFTSANYESVNGAYTTSMRTVATITLDAALAADAITDFVYTLPGFSASWDDGLAALTGLTFR